MRVEEAVAAYLEELAIAHPGSARAWSSALRRASQPAGTYEKPATSVRLNAEDLRRAKRRVGRPRPGLGGRELSSVTNSDLVLLLEAIQEEARTRMNGIKGHGAKETAKTALRSFFAWARRNGHLALDCTPDQGLEYKRRESLERRAYTNAELAEVLAVLDRTRDPELARLFFRLALETGARHGELLGIKVGDLREDSGVIRLAGKGFHGGYLDLPVTAPLFAAIQAFVRARTGRPAKSTPVLLNSAGEPISRRYWEHICGQVREQVPSLGAGEPDWFSAHGLRHTAGTMVQRVGGDAVARRFLGHSARGRSHMENYAKGQIDEVREAMIAIWGVPMAGYTHEYGVNGAHYLRLAALREVAARKREQEDYEIGRYVDGSTGSLEPSPEDFHAAEDRDREERAAEERRLAAIEQATSRRK